MGYTYSKIDDQALRRALSMFGPMEIDLLKTAIFEELDRIRQNISSDREMDFSRFRRVIHRLTGFSLQFHLVACSALAQACDATENNIQASISLMVREIDSTREELSRFFRERVTSMAERLAE